MHLFMGISSKLTVFSSTYNGTVVLLKALTSNELVARGLSFRLRHVQVDPDNTRSDPFRNASKKNAT
jgi:hypothetical protein